MSAAKVLLTLVIVALLAGGAFLGYRYSLNRVNSQAQLSKIDNQIKELPELEEDVFAKCMESTEGGIKNVPFCQENTQKQMHTLSQDLMNAKNDISNKEWHEYFGFN